MVSSGASGGGRWRYSPPSVPPSAHLYPPLLPHDLLGTGRDIRQLRTRGTEPIGRTAAPARGKAPALGMEGHEGAHTPECSTAQQTVWALAQHLAGRASECFRELGQQLLE